ncbi:MAG: hypothetical protein Salg2KO_09530 [Salibacteraceae bacterium]
MFALFISKFCESTEWPKSADLDTFYMGVIADEQVAIALGKYSKVKEIFGKPVQVLFFESIDQVTDVHMLYSDYADGVPASSLFKVIGDHPTLLVTHGYDFNTTMLNLIRKGNMIKFQMNRKNIEKQGLVASNTLDKLATEVDEKDWESELRLLRESLEREQAKSAKLSSENTELNSQVSDLEMEVLALEKDIASLNEEIEESKAELKSIFNRIGVQKDVYQKMVEQLDEKESDLARNQLLLKEKVIELEGKESELVANEKRLQTQRETLEATTQEMMEVEAKMSNALRLLDNQRLVTYGITFIAIIILILGVVAFNNYRKQRRQAVIITAQRDEVESQRDEIHQQHEQLEEKNKEITDSIIYAKRIQEAILPPLKLVKENLEESFILYKPKDIVAGDFYWMETVGETVIFAAADCTGHGVPGAMVSVVCSNALNRSVREFGLTKPAKILDKTLEIVIERFEKSEEEVKDGMDIALCALNTKTKELQYAGANNPLWIVSEKAQLEDGNEAKGQEPDANGLFLHETKATKQPIGKYIDPKPYENHSFKLQEGDSIYVFSDGYPDQFGGEKGKKLKTRAFKELLLSIQEQPMAAQRKVIDDYFETWRGENEQIDDVCVIGVTIG